MNKIKKLFFDIETSPNIGLFWSAGYKRSISHDNIIRERSIICIAYKWIGENEIHSLTWDHYQNDRIMLENFIKIANSADEIIGHNSDRFDLPWIRTRCLYHRIPMFPTYTTLDTLKNARSKFKFNSNKLDYIAKFLGLGQKLHTDYSLWTKILLGNDRKALKEMVEYCKNDVLILEKVYNEMSPYILAKTHHGVLTGKGKHSCPECGSEHVKLSQRRYTVTGTPRIQLQCTQCGKFHTVSQRTFDDINN